MTDQGTGGQHQHGAHDWVVLTGREPHHSIVENSVTRAGPSLATWVETVMNRAGMTTQWADALAKGPPSAPDYGKGPPRERSDTRFLVWLIHDYWEVLFHQTEISGTREVLPDGSLGAPISAPTLRRLNKAERGERGRKHVRNGGVFNRAKHSEPITIDDAIVGLGTLREMMQAIGARTEADYMARPLNSLLRKRLAKEARRMRPKRRPVGKGVRTIGVHWNEPEESAPGWWWVATMDDEQDIRLERGWSTARVVRYLQNQSPPFLAGLAFCFSAPRKYVEERWSGDPSRLWDECAKLTADSDFTPLPDELIGDIVRELGKPFFAPQNGDRPPDLSDREMLRRTERDVRTKTEAVPKSIFEVGTRGTVGALALYGMPLLSELRSDAIAIWPFDKRVIDGGTCVEIFPRSLWAAVFPGTDPALKGDREIRAAFLADKENGLTGVSAEIRSNLVAEHRAFDAMLTAWALRRYGRDLPVPPDVKSAVLEGQIWIPE